MHSDYSLNVNILDPVPTAMADKVVALMNTGPPEFT